MGDGQAKSSLDEVAYPLYPIKAGNLSIHGFVKGLDR